MIKKKSTLIFIMRRIFLVFLVLNCTANLSYAMAKKVDWNQAVDDAIRRYGLRTEPRLKSAFKKAGVSYPPRDIALLAFKKEQTIQLWAKDEHKFWRYIHNYRMTAFSGRLGPKLREHDLQIPEGIYRLTTLNPFSSMHLSMMINYPNDFDRIQAAKDGRKNLGGNIFLHGKSFSVGCLAVGDRAIDQLFLLTKRVGLSHVKLIIAPNDLRQSKPATNSFAQPRWLPALYKNISQSLIAFRDTKHLHDNK